SDLWYYILPITPFCALMSARFLCTSIKEDWEKLLINIVRWLVVGIAIIEAISIVFAALWKQLFDIDLPWMLLLATPIAGLAALFIMFIDERGDRGQLTRLTGMPEPVAGIILAGTVLMAVFFVFQMPSLEKFRTEKPFALNMKNELVNIPPENIIVYPKIPVKLVFYMGLPRPVPVVGDAAEMKKIIAGLTGKFAIVSYNREKYYNELAKVLPRKILEKPDYQEDFAPFENRKKERKLCVWLINGKAALAENRNSAGAVFLPKTQDKEKK
ncbi:MAG: hypothetical protein PHV59_10135, partial [Victivallales bacterium]|nr:hypothetical protein [Victivallales bacterium]